MAQPDFFESRSGRRLAYHRTEGAAPGVVFLGGFRSDMEGTKALCLEDWAKRSGVAFLRFDYSGHGQSSGDFAAGSIGEWAEDAMDAITSLTDGPQVLVGSSMGGWISLLCARDTPESIAGLVTIAAAPDFTEDSFWRYFSDDEKRRLMDEGAIEVPSDYEDPYLITRRLIEDGRERLVLRSPLSLPFPTRFLQGTEDDSVEVSVATRLLKHADGPDLRLTLVKGADHRFSTPECLTLIETSVVEVRKIAMGGNT